MEEAPATPTTTEPARGVKRKGFRRVVEIGEKPVARSAHAMCAEDGRVILVGGYGGPRLQRFSDIHVFDTKTSEWKELMIEGDEEPSQRFGHQCLMWCGSLWLYGGFGVDTDFFHPGATNHLYRFDFGTNKWERVKGSGVEPSPRYDFSMVCYENSIYFYGGECQSNARGSTLFLSHIDKFDLINRTWTRIEPGGVIPCDRMGHSAAVYKDKMYIWGGSNSEREYLADMYKYSFATNMWSLVKPKGTVPTKRRFAKVAKVDDVWYIYGGYSGTYLWDAYMFHFETETWYPLDFVSKENQGVSPRTRNVAVYEGGYMYLFGGQIDDGAVVYDDFHKVPLVISPLKRLCLKALIKRGPAFDLTVLPLELQEEVMLYVKKRKYKEEISKRFKSVVVNSTTEEEEQQNQEMQGN